jgi:hypothetical protein
MRRKAEAAHRFLDPPLVVEVRDARPLVRRSHGCVDVARLSQFLTRNPRKWLILSPRYGANGLRLSPQIDFDRGRFGVVVALVKTSRDDGGSVEPAPRVE